MNLREQIITVSLEIKNELNKPEPSGAEIDRLKSKLANLEVQVNVQSENSRVAVEKYLSECTNENLKDQIKLITDDETLTYKERIVRIKELEKAQVDEYEKVLSEFMAEMGEEVSI